MVSYTSHQILVKVQLRSPQNLLLPKNVIGSFFVLSKFDMIISLNGTADSDIQQRLHFILYNPIATYHV